MKFRRTIVALALLAVPAVPTLALAAPAAAPATAPVRVAAYTFNGGVSATGLIASNSRYGTPLRVRATKDRKSTRLNSSHANISYAVFCLKKKKDTQDS